MPAIDVREARRVIGCALVAFEGCHVRFFAYPDAGGRLCLVCVERPDGTDVLQVLAELEAPIPDICDEYRIEAHFFRGARRRRHTLNDGDVSIAAAPALGKECCVI